MDSVFLGARTAATPEEALRCLHALRHEMVEHRKQTIAGLLKHNTVISSDEELEFMAFAVRESRLQVEVERHARQSSEIDLLQRLATAATLRDDPTGLHGHRVGRLSALTAAKLGWDQRQCWALELAGRLHDIGKSGLPEHILLSRTTLKDAEREFVRTHSTIGHALLSNAPSHEIAKTAEVVLCHHERWDGTGYPSGLSENRIPISARVVAIADVFDALTHGRPYSDPWPVEKALLEIRSQSGHQFDPDICQAFVDLIAGLLAKNTDIDLYITADADNSPFMAARRDIERMLRRGLHATPQNH